MTKGTTWFKADLHIHVPQTAMNDQYRLDAEAKKEILSTEQFKTGNPDKKQLTPQSLVGPIRKKFLEDLIRSDVDMIGLTDYFSVEHFDFYASELRAKGKKVFPNVEFRLTEDAGRGHINLHVVFSDKISTETISEMLKRLQCNGNRLGNIPRSEYDSLTVSLSELKEELKRTFPDREESFFVIVPVRGDGLYDPDMKDGISRRSRSVAQEVAEYADALFGNLTDFQKIKSIDWSGVPRGKPEKKQQSALLELASRIGRPMAVFQGSDAHDFERLSRSLKEGPFTWVRGLRDFSALQQTIVEPRSRICISQRKPGMKNPAHVIKKVTFSDESYMSGVEFNPGLNSVIGPRSSGKSTLLAHTAYAVDSEKTLKAQEASLPERSREDFGPAEGYNWKDALKELEVQVEWADGNVTSYKTKNGTKMVHYVPQNFLFQLSSGDRDNIDKLIQKQISQIEGAKSVADLIETEYSRHRGSVRQAAERYRVACIKKAALEQKIREVGDPKAVQHEFEESKKTLKSINAEGEDLSGRKAVEILEFKEDVNVKVDSLKEAVGVIEERINQLTPKGIWETFFGGESEYPYSHMVYKRVEPAVREAIGSITSEVERVLDQDTKFASVVQENLASYIETSGLAQRAKAFSNLRGPRLSEAKKKYEEDKARLAGFMELQEELKASEKAAKSELDLLVENYQNWSRRSMDLRDKFEQEISSGSNNSSYVNFVEFSRERQRVNNFRDLFLERKQDRGFKEVLSSLDEIDFSAETLSSVSEKLLSGKAKVAAKYRDREDLFMEFCDVLIPKPRFGCSFEGDTIGGFQPTTMTAGKRALFALTVLLEDDDSPWPLLLDQPEDDLDSRSIFKNIAPFLRNGSLHRQILMVTHNANLVVGADSDLIIVINRHSKDYPNGKSNPPIFSTVSGALEESQRKEKPHSPVFLRRKTIKRHICEVVDGGREAFEKRKVRYRGVEPEYDNR
ncbi:TrlF family AAA-like ATPase [Corynebacterium sp. KPL2680]|uniref:TrlF family AAA-like ATPase n=2 Tax=Corynebacterium TaxID=1716 RepID=UPI0032EAC862